MIDFFNCCIISKIRWILNRFDLPLLYHCQCRSNNANYQHPERLIPSFMVPVLAATKIHPNKIYVYNIQSSIHVQNSRKNKKIETYRNITNSNKKFSSWRAVFKGFSFTCADCSCWSNLPGWRPRRWNFPCDDSMVTSDARAFVAPLLLMTTGKKYQNLPWGNKFSIFLAKKKGENCRNRPCKWKIWGVHPKYPLDCYQ